jgi:RNA polymerase sigma factor (sigma-70 family)
MSREQFTDQQIVQAIQVGGVERERVLKYLYDHPEYRSNVSEIVLKGGGNELYCKLVYENCLIQLDKVVRRNEYKSDTLVGFFQTEARIMWCRELITNQSAREGVLNHLSTDKALKGKIRAAVVNNSGSVEDSEDMYQNGLMLIDDHMKEGKFRGGTVKGFLYQVCFNLWRNELKKKKTLPLPDDGVELSITTIDPQKELERKEKADLLGKIFKQLGEKCQQILRLKFFVIDNFSMEEIAQQMGFKNAQTAANALSKCRKNLKELLQQHQPSFE